MKSPRPLPLDRQNAGWPSLIGLHSPPLNVPFRSSPQRVEALHASLLPGAYPLSWNEARVRVAAFAPEWRYAVDERGETPYLCDIL